MMTLYAQTICPKCELAKTVLKNAKADFVISYDTDAALKLGITEVPCLVDGENRYTYPQILQKYKEANPYA